MKTAVATLTLLTTCCALESSAQWATRRAEVLFPDKTRVQVEVADTDERRQRGLMFRESMAEGEGMIFVFPQQGLPPFWMKNTLIPLDMLWLDASGRIVAIAQSVPPCKADPCPSYPPPNPLGDATFVVELVSGFSKKHALKQGDMLTLKGVSPSDGK